MKKKWKGWLCLCLACALCFAFLPTAVNADGEFANLRLYTGSARVTSDMYVSDDIGTYAESVNENCPAGYTQDGYRLWRVDDAKYTVASRWVSASEADWPAYMTGYFAPENVVLAPNWVPEYSANPITAENPTVVIGDGSAQDRGEFYYQWLHERRLVDIGNYHDETEQIKAAEAVNAAYNSESGKWVTGNGQPYMELRIPLQRGDVVAVKNIGGGTNSQQYFSGYLKGGNGSAYLESYDHNNDVFYVTSMSSGDCYLHMQNNMDPYSLEVSVTVSRYEAEDGEVGTKTYTGDAGSYCCKISYVKNGSQISFLTNSVTIKANKPGGDQPGGDEPGGDNPGGNEPGGNEPGGDNPGGNEPGGDNPGGNETKEFAIAKGPETKQGSFAPKINGQQVDKAMPGQTVTVETYPAQGYKTEIITYRKTDGTDQPVTVPMGGDGNGCFVMPEYNVTVEVRFHKESADVEPSQPPLIEIALDGTKHIWNTFSSNVSFDLIYNQAKQIKINVMDADNDADPGTMQYCLAHECLFPEDREYTPQEIEEVIGGKWKNSKDSVKLKADGKYVLYVKASDRAGNTAYASTQGIVIDATAPVISGLKDGSEYYGTIKYHVKDANLKSVSLDGKNVKPQKGMFTIKPDNASHKIVATDLAGNKTICEVSVYKTWMRDGIKKSGVYSLKKGTAYKLGKGKWKIIGDDTVYNGGTAIYVPETGDYDFRKQ